MAVKPIKIKILGVDLFSNKVAGINKKLRSVGKSVGRVGRTLALTASLPALALGASILKSAGDFEQAMNTVKVVSREVGEKGINDLREQAKKLGIETQFSATQSAGAMVELGKAGLNTTEVFKASRAVLELAGAGQIEMSEAAGLATVAMTIFGKKAEDIGEIGDVLTRGFTSAKQSIQELGTAIVFGGSAASAMGLSFKDTAAILSAFARAGEKGTLGGTKLRKVMTSLVDPTADAKGAFVKLGIGLTDVFEIGKNGQRTFKGMINLVKQFEKSNFGLNESVRIFGQRAGPVMFKVVQKGSKSLEELRAVMDNTGITAKKVSEAQLAGFNGQVRLLISAFEGFKIAIADAGILEFATKLARKITRLFSSLAKSNPALLKLGFILLTLTAIIGPLLIVIGAVIAALGFISLPVAGIVTGIVLLIAGIGALVLKWQTVVSWTKKVAKGFVNLLDPTGTLSGVAKTLKNNWSDVLDIFRKVWNIVKSLTGSFTDLIKTKVGNFLKIFGFTTQTGANIREQDTRERETEENRIVDVREQRESAIDRVFKGVLGKLDSTLSRIEVKFANQPPGMETRIVEGGENVDLSTGLASGGT